MNGKQVLRIRHGIEQHEALDVLGVTHGVQPRHEATERVACKIHLVEAELDAQLFEERNERLGVVAAFWIGPGEAETRKIDANDPERVGELGDPAVPRMQRRHQAMQEHEWRPLRGSPFPNARVGDVHAQAVHLDVARGR